MNKSTNQLSYIPIVFIHTGYCSYLEYTLRQAKHTNPESEIILLGDDANDRFPFITHVNIKDFSSKASEFAKIYKHYSTNPYNYELFCFQRWFILEEYIKTNQQNLILVCDSDVLLYSNITDTYYNSYNEKPDIIPIMAQNFKTISLGMSYLKTKYISSINLFINDIFQDKKALKKLKELWKKEIQNNTIGAISDMTIVKLFYEKNKATLLFASLNQIRTNSAFDNNINTTHCFEQNEYKTKLGIKKITWKNNIPFCYNLLKKEYIKLNCLHMQGPAKYLIARFYTCEKFPDKLKLDFIFFFNNILAHLYKKLKIRYHFSWLFNIVFRLKRYNK